MSLFSKKVFPLGIKKTDTIILDDQSLSQVHAYLLGNCDDIQEYIRYLNLNIPFLLYN